MGRASRMPGRYGSASDPVPAAGAGAAVSPPPRSPRFETGAETPYRRSRDPRARTAAGPVPAAPHRQGSDRPGPAASAGPVPSRRRSR